MLYQVAREYHGLNAASLTIAEIVFWYDGLRPELKKYTRAKSNSG